MSLKWMWMLHFSAYCSLYPPRVDVGDVAVCCVCVLHCVAVCGSVLQCVAVWSSVLKYVAMCCGELQ